MGILKKIDRGIRKAEKSYHKAEKDTRGIRKTGMKIIDFIVPPPKKKKTKRVKIGKCKCTCPK